MIFPRRQLRWRFPVPARSAFSLGSKLDRVERHIDRVMLQDCGAKLTPITFAGCFVDAVQALLCSSNLLRNSSMYVDPESLTESAHTRSVVPRDPDGVADLRHFDTVKALHRFPWCRPSRRFPISADSIGAQRVARRTLAHPRVIEALIARSRDDIREVRYRATPRLAHFSRLQFREDSLRDTLVALPTECVAARIA
ncbi:hypothetical protein [Burkholderia gladioli]|uniref:hypothetical protein n=1 Tax=Burkholderia gladioli TaxID=28095 RepID=UPI003D254CD9